MNVNAITVFFRNKSYFILNKNAIYVHHFFYFHSKSKQKKNTCRSWSTWNQVRTILTSLSIPYIHVCASEQDQLPIRFRCFITLNSRLENDLQYDDDDDDDDEDYDDDHDDNDDE